MSFLGGFAGLGGGSIGRASVDLVLNAATYTGELEAAEAKTAASTSSMGKGFKGFQDSVKKSFSGAQLAVVGFGAVAAIAIGKAIGATTEWAGQVRSLQRVTGQTAESASALAGAASILGLDVDSLNTGFGLLSKNIVNAAPNLTKYGIAVKDATGAVLPFDDVLAQVSDKFATLPKGPEQAAFAMNVFGRSGKALIPILQQGSDGLAELEQKAKDAGLVMSQDDVDAAKKLSRAQHELSDAFKGAAVQLGTAFLPVMTSITNVLVTVVELVQKVPGPVLSIGTAFVTVAAVLIVAQKAWVALNATIVQTGVALRTAIPLMIEFTSVAQEAGKKYATAFVDAKGAAIAAGGVITQTQQDSRDAFAATSAGIDLYTTHLDKAGNRVVNFAAMTSDALKEWKKSVTASITDTFLTLGTKTKDIFNVTQKQLDHDFEVMLSNALRFKADLTALLALKPGTFGLSPVDLQQFEVFMQQRGPGFVDAFVKASHAKQQEWIDEWRRSSGAVHDAIQRAVPPVTHTKVVIDFEANLAAVSYRNIANEVRNELINQSRSNAGRTGLP